MDSVRWISTNNSYFNPTTHDLTLVLIAHSFFFLLLPSIPVLSLVLFLSLFLSLSLHVIYQLAYRTKSFTTTGLVP